MLGKILKQGITFSKDPRFLTFEEIVCESGLNSKQLYGYWQEAKKRTFPFSKKEDKIVDILLSTYTKSVIFFATSAVWMHPQRNLCYSPQIEHPDTWYHALKMHSGKDSANYYECYHRFVEWYPPNEYFEEPIFDIISPEEADFCTNSEKLKRKNIHRDVFLYDATPKIVTIRFAMSLPEEFKSISQNLDNVYMVKYVKGDGYFPERLYFNSSPAK